MRFLHIILILFSLSGCDIIYAQLHKPGGEERKILGDVVFNEYSQKVEELQHLLKIFGYNIGRADGKLGPGTRDAVAKFQQDEGLEVTRFVDKKTWARMEAYSTGPFITKNKQLNALNIQKALKKAGFPPPKIDGQMGGKTRECIKAFQKSVGLSPDGHVGLKTIKALSKYAE